jgi:hypothetical protein
MLGQLHDLTAWEWQCLTGTPDERRPRQGLLTPGLRRYLRVCLSLAIGARIAGFLQEDRN